MTLLDALSVRCTEFPITQTRPRRPGVYFLILDGAIVYIGASTDIESRIAGHVRAMQPLDGWGKRRRVPRTRRRGKQLKRFDRVIWLAVDESDLFAFEGALIRAIRPAGNRSAPMWTGRDNEVLTKLGLAIHADERAVAADWLETRECKGGATNRRRLQARTA